jgi:hypothetical protein
MARALVGVFLRARALGLCLCVLARGRACPRARALSTGLGGRLISVGPSMQRIPIYIVWIIPSHIHVSGGSFCLPVICRRTAPNRRCHAWRKYDFTMTHGCGADSAEACLKIEGCKCHSASTRPRQPDCNMFWSQSRITSLKLSCE